MKHKDTPITNAAAYNSQPGNPSFPEGLEVVPAHVARKLERKLAAIRKGASRAKDLVFVDANTCEDENCYVNRRRFLYHEVEVNVNGRAVLRGNFVQLYFSAMMHGKNKTVLNLQFGEKK